MLKKIFFGCVAITALFVAIGSMGYYDTDLSRCLVTVAICVFVELVALKIINA